MALGARSPFRGASHGGGHRGTDDDAHSTTACMRTCTTHRNAKMIVPSSHSALGHWAQPQPPPFFIFIRYHTRLVSPTLPISIPPLASWVVGCFPASAASGSSAPRQVREEEEIKKTIEQRRCGGTHLGAETWPAKPASGAVFGERAMVPCAASRAYAMLARCWMQLTPCQTTVGKNQ
eukprot:scaffold27355_cov135-Isochrysis_galbana.AAC.6